MIDLLLPLTDRAVMIQALVLIPLEITAIWIFRRNADLRLLLIGVLVLTVGWMGLRALH